MIEKIAEFTRAYHFALERAFQERGRQNFPYHGEETRLVNIFKASNGFVTFYLPPPPDPSIPHGYYAYDDSAYDLNTICQSLSIHRLKIASPRLGKPWNTFEDPPDAATIPDLLSPWIHEDLRQAVKDGKLTSLPGMTLSPIIDIKQGIRQAVAPARIVIWAPIFDFPDIGKRRLYLWTHADFWWFPERLDLDPRKAEVIATQDLLALETILRNIPELTPEAAQQDTALQAADILERQCDEFTTLLNESGHREEVLHQWLNDQRHHVFLDAHAVEVKSKVPFGTKESDFVIRRSDGTYLLIEIERANTPIFRHDNSEPTAPFNHACQQVHDWQRYIRDNVHTVRTEQNLPGIYEPRGMVLMGRTASIDSGEAKIRWRDMKNRYDLSLNTYDEVCDHVRAIAASLRVLLHGHQI